MKKTNPIKLSFIVPCYNVERYIVECLDSIYSQNIDTDLYEVICVDDASPDNVYSVLKEYGKSHYNMRIVCNSMNLGLGGARNVGIKEAEGEYIWFVDADDLIAKDAVKRIMEEVMSNKSDVLMFNFELVDENKDTIKTVRSFSQYVSMGGLDFIHKVFNVHELTYYFGFVWRTVYRLEFLKQNSICFPERMAWEDTVFLPRAVLYADNVTALPIVGYRYRQNQYSISAEMRKMQNPDLFFQYYFVAGLMIIDLAKDIATIDKDIFIEINKLALSRLNSFWLSLARIPREKLSSFYKTINFNRQTVLQVWTSLTFMSKLLLNKRIGFYFAYILNIIYSVKHSKMRILL